MEGTSSGIRIGREFEIETGCWKSKLNGQNRTFALDTAILSSDVFVLGDIKITVDDIRSVADGALDRVHLSTAFIKTLPAKSQVSIAHRTFGVSPSIELARVKAVMESLELTHTERPIQRQYIGSYEEFKEFAVYPPSMLLFSEDEVNKHDFPFRRYFDRLQIPWVWGYNITKDLPQLVPVDCVYTSANPERPLVHTDATGGAAHSDMVKAILHGLYEVVERDALMITWMNGQKCPHVHLGLEGNPVGEALLRRAEQLNGEVAILDLTTDLSITTIVAILYSSKLPWGLAVGSGADIDLSKALEKAALEVFISAEFQVMEDSPLHAIANRWKETWVKWLHVLSGGGHSSFSSKQDPGDTDKSQLKRCIELLRKKMLDVIVVDCGQPSITELGIYCVRVLIPYMQPRFLVESDPRRLGSHRLYEVPKWLGAGGGLADLNTSMHPFI